VTAAAGAVADLGDDGREAALHAGAGARPIDPTPLRLTGLEPPIVVIPMARWDKMTEKAMRFGMLMSPMVKVVHVDSDDSDALGAVWETMVLVPVRASTTLPSRSW
jgi:hypothetical protein